MPARRLERLLAGTSLALVLVVIVATATIRLSAHDLGSFLPVLRATHRASASLAALLILGAGWLAWRGGRRQLAALLLAMTVFLSVLGAATGIGPPPWAQAGNLLGGLLLAVLLAWLLGEKEYPDTLLWAAVALQLCLGAWIAVFAETLWTPVLLAHALLGASLAAGAAWIAVKKGALVPVVLAIAVVASGAASALFGLPLGAALAHSASVALLICAAAYAHARLA